MSDSRSRAILSRPFLPTESSRATVDSRTGRYAEIRRKRAGAKRIWVRLGWDAAPVPYDDADAALAAFLAFVFDDAPQPGDEPPVPPTSEEAHADAERAAERATEAYHAAINDDEDRAVRPATAVLHSALVALRDALARDAGMPDRQWPAGEADDESETDAEALADALEGEVGQILMSLDPSADEGDTEDDAMTPAERVDAADEARLLIEAVLLRWDRSVLSA